MTSQDVRRIEKILTGAGIVPTVAPSDDHTDGSWVSTDIYPGELCINTTDKIVYMSDGETITAIGGEFVPTFAQVLGEDPHTDGNDLVIDVGDSISFSSGLFAGALTSNLLTADRSWELPDKDGRLLTDLDLNGVQDRVVLFNTTGIYSSAKFRFEDVSGTYYLSLYTEAGIRFMHPQGKIFMSNSNTGVARIQAANTVNGGATVLLYGGANTDLPGGVRFAHSAFEAPENEYMNFTYGLFEGSNQKKGTIKSRLEFWSQDNFQIFDVRGDHDFRLFAATELLDIQIGVQGGKSIKLLSECTPGSEIVSLEILGDDIILTSGATNPAGSTGFVYIPAIASSPTGVPVGYSGRVPFIYDETNHKVWINDPGLGWISTAALS